VSEIITVSAGISAITPSRDKKPHMLIEAADKLLYQAKEKGRNQYQF